MDTKKYNCEDCNKEYKSYMGLWKHNKKYHTDLNINNKQLFNCTHCNKNLSCKQSKWKHEQKCKINNNKTLEEQFKKLSEEIEKIKSQPNTINNNTTNIQYVINSPSTSSINHLSFELQQDILDKGLNSLIYLIELVNFNKSVPENHSYCVTAINDKHASVIDEKTNTIIKTNKFELFDKVLGTNLDNLEKIMSNPKFTSKQRYEYKNKIDYLKTSIFENNNFMKRYQNDINLISYNNKELIKETWKNLKPKSNSNLTDCEYYDNEEQEYYGSKPKGFDDLIKLDKIDIEKPKCKPIIEVSLESSEDAEDAEDAEDDIIVEDNNYDVIEIKLNNQIYILEDTNVYYKNDNKTKGKLYGIYKNGKINKIDY